MSRVGVRTLSSLKSQHIATKLRNRIRISSLLNKLFIRLLVVRIVASTDRKVFHFIRVLTGGNNTEVITKLLLLQVSLGKVLQLTLAELEVSWTGDSQLCAVSGDNDILGREVSSLSINLDSVMKVLFELGHIEDLIVHGLCAVNDELGGGFLSLDLGWW